MSWFRSDDGLWRHPKVRKLGRDRLPALGLWTLAGTWCADNVETNVTDGFVPDEQVSNWDPRHRCAKRLVAVGLWTRAEADGERGYRFHDWSHYQRTRETVAEERKSWRERQERVRVTRDSHRDSRRESPSDSPRDSDRDSQRDSPSDSQRDSRRDSPVSHASPIPIPLSGYFGEGESPTERARENETPLENQDQKRPDDRCPDHRGTANPPPCGQCADHRRAAERFDTEQAERQHAADLAIRRCRDCDGDGRRWHPDGKHLGTINEHCDHTRTFVNHHGP